MAYVIDKELIKKPKEKHWISYIKQRIRKNKNFLGFISGPTGSGKSYSSIRICAELDPEFDIDRVVFSGIELMNLINSGKLKKGSAICFEEVGVEMSNKNWASATNKMINYLMQTFRHRNFILIMNSPYMDFVDSATRKLFHAEMQTISIDKTKEEVLLKPQLIQYNSRMQKFYYKRLKVITAEGKVPIDLWRVAKPSKELLKAYEQKKREYTDRLNKKILRELEHVEELSDKKPLTELQKKIIECWKKGITKQLDIAKELNQYQGNISRNISFMKRKGWKYEDYM